MKDGLKNAKKFFLPLSGVATASMLGILLLGGQSSAPASVSITAGAVSPETLASFKPVVDSSAGKETRYDGSFVGPRYVFVHDSVVAKAPGSQSELEGSVGLLGSSNLTGHATGSQTVKGSSSSTGQPGGENSPEAKPLAQPAAPENITVSGSTITVLSTYHFTLYYGTITVTGKNGKVTVTTSKK
jgi:hypothetical protein